MVYILQEKLHMSWYEVMWKRSWINLIMQLGDSPKTIKQEEVIVEVTGKQMAAEDAADEKYG